MEITGVNRSMASGQVLKALFRFVYGRQYPHIRKSLISEPCQLTRAADYVETWADDETPWIFHSFSWIVVWIKWQYFVSKKVYVNTSLIDLLSYPRCSFTQGRKLMDWRASPNPIFKSANTQPRLNTVNYFNINNIHVVIISIVRT